ncbi:hypothetical protein B0H17DRAFT_1336424 [Mycena rosella]|uniref:Uncharacterized protein n=1 Tax=Mycena rosella TaxID=1033263 RepID=A0AAD7CW08_MYCRO|nr:hypothetical protein B0H17DRAFT_1336424 [Mycena rosella]
MTKTDARTPLSTRSLWKCEQNLYGMLDGSVGKTSQDLKSQPGCHRRSMEKNNIKVDTLIVFAAFYRARALKLHLSVKQHIPFRDVGLRRTDRQFLLDSYGLWAYMYNGDDICTYFFAYWGSDHLAIFPLATSSGWCSRWRRFGLYNRHDERLGCAHNSSHGQSERRCLMEHSPPASSTRVHDHLERADRQIFPPEDQRTCATQLTPAVGRPCFRLLSTDTPGALNAIYSERAIHGAVKHHEGSGKGSACPYPRVYGRSPSLWTLRSQRASFKVFRRPDFVSSTARATQSTPQANWESYLQAFCA